MTSQIFFVVLAFFGVWLLLLSFLFGQMFLHYSKLTKGTNNKNLKTILEDLLKEVEKSKTDTDFLKDYCDKIQKDSLLHIQKIGLVRFNPFNDTGGDQSFVLSLTDGRDTGVIISGLYSRAGTRWYAKKVVDGKGVEHELTEEEKKVLRSEKLK